MAKSINKIDFKGIVSGLLDSLGCAKSSNDYAHPHGFSNNSGIFIVDDTVNNDVFLPGKKIKIIPNNPESGENRMFINSGLCEKCSTQFRVTGIESNLTDPPDVLICTNCGHEQKVKHKTIFSKVK